MSDIESDDIYKWLNDKVTQIVISRIQLLKADSQNQAHICIRGDKFNEAIRYVTAMDSFQDVLDLPVNMMEELKNES